MYQSDVKAKSDWNAGIRYAEKKATERGLATGLEIGRHEEALEIAIKLKAKGMSLEEINEITCLGIEEIEKL